jgi:hypothetical protein
MRAANSSSNSTTTKACLLARVPLRHWHFERRYGRFAVELSALLLLHSVAATRHILTTGPTRLVHERKMRKRRAV